MTLVELFKNIADSFRKMTGTTATIKASEIANKIAAIKNNGAISKTIGVGQTYIIPAGYHNGGGKVTSNIANKGAISGSVGVGGTYSNNPYGYVSVIKVTGPTLDGNADEGQVLNGYTFYKNSGTKKTGNMANRGAWNATINAGGSVAIPAGYHNGSGYVKANTNAPSLQCLNMSAENEVVYDLGAVCIQGYVSLDTRVHGWNSAGVCRFRMYGSNDNANWTQLQDTGEMQPGANKETNYWYTWGFSGYRYIKTYWWKGNADWYYLRGELFYYV